MLSATLKRIIAAAVLWAAAAALFLMLVAFGENGACVTFAGDVLLARGVATAIELYGEHYPFEGVSAMLRDDDLTVANLECPLYLGGGAAMKDKRFIFRADPGLSEIMRAAGFDAFSLANNHTMDYLGGGLAETMAALDAAGVGHFGASADGGTQQPLFYDANGVRLGFLGYSCLPPEGFFHVDGSPSVAYARAGFTEVMRAEIAAAAARCDFLTVYFHWGTEYRHDVNDEQRGVARDAADAGASLVIGAHPHVLQGAEMYGGVPIYYSLGNFVFDNQLPEGTDETIMLRVTVTRAGLATIEELPVVIENCRPKLAQGERAEEILGKLRRYSGE